VVDGFEQIRFALLRPLVPRKKQKVRAKSHITKITGGLHEKMTGQCLEKTNGKRNFQFLRALQNPSKSL
jgi:hypothetical protein